ncbi:MAG: hypothetical protein ACE5DO_15480, partial [Desulfobacterales bacterium]
AAPDYHDHHVQRMALRHPDRACRKKCCQRPGGYLRRLRLVADRRIFISDSSRGGKTREALAGEVVGKYRE